MSPDRFDISVFGFGEGDDVGVGVVGEDLLKVYDGCVHATGVEREDF